MALNTRLTYKNKEVQHCSIQIYRDQIVPQYFAEDQLKKQTHTHTHTHAHAHTHTRTRVSLKRMYAHNDSFESGALTALNRPTIGMASSDTKEASSM